MIEIRDLFVTYGTLGRRVEAVRGVSLDISRQRITALVGESGSGKSTLLMSILGLLPPGTATAGEIRHGGRNLLPLDDSEMAEYRWEEIALIPQGAMNSFTPVLTLGGQIEEVLSVHSDISGAEARGEALRLLDEAGLEPELARRYPHELSGGQKQRGAIALALACEPYYLLADEPTTALDVIIQAEILTLLADLVRRRGMGMLLVTHDIALAASICDEMAVMKDGLIVERGNPGEITRSPAHDHTRALVDSLAVLERGF